MIDILYETKDILVCVKPSGTLSERSEDANSLPLIIETECAAQKRHISLFTVHRLDREVCGVMVYAKNPIAAKNLSEQISNRNFHKEYLAIVEGTLEKDSDVLTDLLFKDSRKNKTYVVDRNRKGVKDASLEYTTLERQNGTSLLKIILHTGRTHQIRVQFASRGCPIIGDRKYGSQKNLREITLCSHKIEFDDPVSKKHLSFTYLPTALDIWNSYSETLKKAES